MSSTPLQILVIDDETAIRDSLSAFLEDQGYLVDAVESAEEALLAIDNREYHLMVVDLRLPGMTGDQLIMTVHQQQPRTKFLIHTGSMDYRLSEELRAIGMDEQRIFSKPVHDLALLVDAIESLVAR